MEKKDMEKLLRIIGINQKLIELDQRREFESGMGDAKYWLKTCSEMQGLRISRGRLLSSLIKEYELDVKIIKNKELKTVVI